MATSELVIATEAWPPRRVVSVSLVCLAVAGAFAVGIALRHVLTCLLLGIVLDTALAPLFAWLKRLGLSRAWSIVGVYVTVTVAALTGIAWGTVPLVEQGMKFIAALPDTYLQLREQLAAMPGGLVRRILAMMPESLPPLSGSSGVGTQAAQALGTQTRWGEAVIEALFWTGAVLLLAFNWSLQKERSLGSVLLFVPDGRRDATRELFEEMQGRVGAFVRGQGLLCLAVGVLSLVAYLLIGLPNALLLGVLAGVLELVPYFGPVLSTVPALLVAVAVAPQLILPVLAVAIAVQFLENNFLVPKIMDSTVGVHPVVTLLALVAFTNLMGMIGMFLAIPLAAILQVAFDRFVLRADETEPLAPDGRDAASRALYEARDLVQDVRRQLREKRTEPTTASDQVEDSIEAIAADLEERLAEYDVDGSQSAPGKRNGAATGVDRRRAGP